VAVAVLLDAGLAALILRGEPQRPAVVTLPARHGIGGAAAVAVDGSHVWVASSTVNGAGSVTELSARDGRWLRTIAGVQEGLRYPSGIAAAAAHIWITNDPQTGDGRIPRPGDGTVTELAASNGSLIRTLGGSRYQFDFPGPIAVVGRNIWVGNSFGGRTGNGSLTELSGSTGALIRSAAGSDINDPVDLVADGNDLWILNSFSDDSGSVTKLNARTGRVIWMAAGARYGFTDPIAFALNGDRLWVANEYAAGGGGSVTELSASTGRWIRTLSGGCYGFDSPAGVAVAGGYVWVANSYIDADAGSVTEYSASNGRWIQTLSSGPWIENVLPAGCTDDLFTAGYSFANPALIAAVGKRIWVFDGPVTILRTG
jgi:DNA-binding beta-propeller fold protein YncE